MGIEPLEDMRRAADLPLSGVAAALVTSCVEQDTPLTLKRATYIIETADESDGSGGSSAMAKPNDADGGELQSVAALRQAAREVFLSASPKASPIASHKQSTFRKDSGCSAAPLSAANVVGLPLTLSSENCLPPIKQGRLPPPKYHFNAAGSAGSSSHSPPSPLPLPAATSRIPLASHNRLPSGLLRQTSSISSGSSSHPDEPELRKPEAAPTVLPKLSAFHSTSRIPAPNHVQVQVTPNQSKSFSLLPPPPPRMLATPTPATGSGTRIPVASFKAGPSPVSRIPTRLPTPTSSNPPPFKGKRSLDSAEHPASPALTYNHSRLQ